VAFIDWSSCHPGDRLDDLGYLAWTWCIQSQGRVPITEQARHLWELRDGYGTVEPAHLLDAIVRGQTHIANAETANIEDPTLTPARRSHPKAPVAWATADRELIHRHQPLLLPALQGTG
jgi:aminoglycoside phosphotransferase (APT) family kinase protein